MDGMGMMLKSFGFDTEKIKTEMQQAKQLIEEKVTSIDDKLKYVDESQTRLYDKMIRIEGIITDIALKLEALTPERLQAMLDGCPQPTPEELEREFYNVGRIDSDRNKSN